MTQTRAQAEANVLQAITHANTPAFIGIEHLNPLAAHWHPQRPALVIEPSRERAQEFIAQQKSRAPQPPIYLFCGSMGSFPSSRAAWTTPLLLSQEIGEIILAISELPDELLMSLTPYAVNREAADPIFTNSLIDSLYLLAATASTHHELAPLYAQVRRLQPGNTTVILQAPQISENAVEPVPLGLFQILAGDGLCVPLTLKRPDFTLPDSFKIAAEATARELLAIQPRQVATLNRAAFPELIDVLLNEGLLQRCGFNIQFVYRDWFTQQSSLFNGGWSFEWFADHGKSGTFYTIYETHSTGHLPSALPTFAYPVDYVKAGEVFTTPLTDDADFTRDIAIIHSTRLHALISPEINELFAIITGQPHLFTGIECYYFLNQLRNSFASDTRLPRSSYAWRALINAMDFFFYNQVRIHNAIKVAQQFTDYRLTVFGLNWDRFLPAKFCGGWISSEDELRTIWRTAKVTIDFAQTYSHLTPHLTAVHCLAAGGMPLFIKPFLKDARTLKAQHAAPPDFSSMAELANLVNRFLDPVKRAHAIKTAQAEWLPQLVARADVIRPLELGNQPTLIDGPPTLQMPIDALLAIGEAYLLLLCGYRQAALDCFRDVLQKYEPKQSLIWERAIAIARDLDQAAVIAELTAARPSKNQS